MPTTSLARLCRFRLISNITRVCTTLTFSSPVASFGRPDRPSSSTLSLLLLNSAAHVSCAIRRRLLPKDFHEVCLNFLGRYSFLTEVLDNRSYQVSPFCKCVAPPSLKSASHKQSSMTACFSHSQCPSVRSNEQLTKICIQ